MALPALVRESGWAAHDLGGKWRQDARGNPAPDCPAAGDAVLLVLELSSRGG